MGLSGSQLAYKQARAGVERADASRAGYYRTNLVVTINGTDRTHDVGWNNSLDVSLTLNDEPDTATFTLKPGTVMPAENQPVIVGLGAAGNPLFGGVVLSVRHTRKPGFRDPFMAVTCTSWLRQFDRRLVTAAYTNVSATAILHDIIDRYTSGFSGSAIEEGMAVIDDLQITNERPSTVFRKVTGLVGGSFRVDGRKLVHAWSDGAETGPHAPSAPAALSASSTTLRGFGYSREGSQQRTRVIVQGNGSRTVFAAAPGDSTLVLEDGTYFSASGGGAVVGLNVVSYTGLGARYAQSRDWSTRLAPQSNRWRAIAWSPDLALFVALSFDGSTRAMYSADGITWTLASRIDANSWLSVIWVADAGWFVAVSYNGTYRVAISIDGSFWASANASEANSWSDLVYSPSLGLIVAVAVDGTHRVMTSPEGANWTNQTAASANQWVSVTWAESLGLFVAVAADSPSGSDAAMTSPDGITWTARSLPFANWSVVVWAEALGRLIALNADETNSMAAYSSNGVSWGTVEIPAGAWIGLTWVAELGLFVACSEKSTEPARIITSPDGFTWSTDFTDDIDGNSAAIAWSPELGIIVVGTDDERHPVLTNSPTRYTTLAGIPSGGDGSIRYDVPIGTDVKIRVQVDDAAAQAVLAAVEGGDGIYEHIVEDGRYSIEGATARASAELAAFGAAIEQANWETSDMRVLPGASQTIAFV